MKIDGKLTTYFNNYVVDDKWVLLQYNFFLLQDNSKHHQ